MLEKIMFDSEKEMLLFIGCLSYDSIEINKYVDEKVGHTFYELIYFQNNCHN